MKALLARGRENRISATALHFDREVDLASEHSQPDKACFVVETQTQHGGAVNRHVCGTRPRTPAARALPLLMPYIHCAAIQSLVSLARALAATVLQASAAVSRHVVLSSLVVLLWTASRTRLSLPLSRVFSHSGRRSSRNRIRLSVPHQVHVIFNREEKTLSRSSRRRRRRGSVNENDSPPAPSAANQLPRQPLLLQPNK